MGETTPQRYNSIAIILHWVMAIGFLMMLGSGVAMSYIELEQSLKFNLYQWHKGGGVLLLIAFVLRFGWRIVSQVKGWIPALPEDFPKLEKLAAKAGHWALYVLMIAMPLTGWLMVSASVYGLPTVVFGWFEWPHIPGVEGNEALNKLAKDLHFYLAIAFGLTIAGHIGAVVKHKIVDGENLMNRMWWSKGE